MACGRGTTGHMLQELEQLAHSSSSASRATLMMALADLYLHGNTARTEAEKGIFSEVILNLLECVEEHERAGLSQKLAPSDQAPPCLMFALANDKFPVAQPVLEISKVLDETHLYKLASKLGEGHLEVIACRDDLSCKVSDCLIQRGGKKVLRNVVGNRQINLSGWGMRCLAKQSLKDVVLREDLALRRDLTPAVCKALLPHVSGDTKKRLESVVAGTTTANDLDGIADRKQMRRELGIRLEAASISELWTMARQSELELDQLVIILADDNRLPHVADLLANTGVATASELRESIYNGDPTKFVAASIAAGLKQETFERLAIARCDHVKISEKLADVWIEDYRTIVAQSVGVDSRRRRRVGAL